LEGYRGRKWIFFQRLTATQIWAWFSHAHQTRKAGMADPWKSSTAFRHASVVLSSKVVAGLFLSPEARQPTDDPEQPTSPALAVLVEAVRLIVAGHCLKGRKLAFPS
jgi:hypothetical protein